MKMTNLRLKLFSLECDVDIKLETYKDNGRLAVILVASDTEYNSKLRIPRGEVIIKLSVNCPESSCGFDEFFVKHWDENRGIEYFISEHKIATPQDVVARCGLEGAYRYRLNEDLVNELLAEPLEGSEGPEDIPLHT